MQNFLEYLEEHDLEATMFWSLEALDERSKLEDIRDRVLDFAEVANGKVRVPGSPFAALSKEPSEMLNCRTLRRMS